MNNLDSDLLAFAERLAPRPTDCRIDGSGPIAQVYATLLLVQAVRDLATDIRRHA